MPNTYYIDGYNVIHHSALLRPLADQDFEAARAALVEKVSRFCVATGNQAKIIFDGRGRQPDPVAPLAQVPGLEVLYSPGHQSADTLIERIVYAAEDRRSIIVVSGDRGIRALCRGLNALVMEPDNFLATVRDADADTRRALQHIQRPDTLRRIENRLDATDLDRLNRIKKDLET
jgi:predicted RNA-binding protein with PIN domain